MNRNERILVVDDEAAIRALLEEVLRREGFACATARSGDEAVELLRTEPFDIVGTDIRMPGISGIDLTRHVRAETEADVIVLTAFSSDYQYEAMAAEGASDFILKPCRPTEFVARVRRVLGERRLRSERDRAERELRNAMAEVRDAYLDTIHRLAIATEFKDVDTGDHIVRMGRMSEMLAEAAGMSEEDCDNVLYGAPMHDVGKIGIPDSILLKTGRLTPQEFEVMKTHTTIGASILERPKSAILECARTIALSHHEQWDGNGYPQGLRRDAIPLSGRIVRLADVFDALVSSRPYKKAYPLETALELIVQGRETQFDPDLVDLLLRKTDDIMRIRQQVGEPEVLPQGVCDWSERDNALRNML